jgi:hypothetical protein
VITKPDTSHAESAEVADSKSEEAQLADSEQATYASANNDLKGTKAYQEADVSGLYNLAMAIIDYRGHRVVAQVCIEITCPVIYSAFRIFCCFYYVFCNLFFSLITSFCVLLCQNVTNGKLNSLTFQLYWTCRVSYLVFFKETSQIPFCMALLIMARRYLGTKRSIQRSVVIKSEQFFFSVERSLKIVFIFLYK